MGPTCSRRPACTRRAKIVIAGTVCAYPKFTPVPFPEDDLWNGYPEETNAPYGIAKKAVLVSAQAYRQQYGTNASSSCPSTLRPPRQLRPRDSHVIPAMIASGRGKRGDGTNSGATARHARVPLRRRLRRGLALAAERYDEPDPVNLGTGFEIAIAIWPSTSRAATGYKGEIRWDASHPNGQPRRRLDTTRAEELFGFRRRRRSRGPRADRRLVPRRTALACTRPTGTGLRPNRRSRPPPAPRPTRLARPRRRRPARDRRLPDPRDHRALLLRRHNGWLTYQGGDQIWLVTTGWLLGNGTIGVRTHGLRLADAARAADVDHRLELGRAPAGDDRPAGRRARPDRHARRLRHRRAGRGPPRRPLVRGRVLRSAPFVAIPYFVAALSRQWVDQFCRRRSG